ncbi:MAG: type II toxin-antitoxin system VapC family toxin [Proteobacteria bacterium]|nr:type II toxin-antitoxin system VapC family toxin [Pseudomonadota bacterium]
MARVALDTTFLIDVQNERRGRGPSRGAIAYLRSSPEAELYLPTIALGEYLQGFADPTSAAATALTAFLNLLPVTAEVATLYAETVRVLRSKGQLIGTNDLWIACTARAAALPILTRNSGHFRRVPRLRVIDYTA